jgi:hypothetical protein
MALNGAPQGAPEGVSSGILVTNYLLVLTKYRCEHVAESFMKMHNNAHTYEKVTCMTFTMFTIMKI